MPAAFPCTAHALLTLLQKHMRDVAQPLRSGSCREHEASHCEKAVWAKQPSLAKQSHLACCC
jgi:hypothetical protein